MRILFVANRVPYPPFRGDKLKIYNLAKRLSTRHQLSLITFAESKEDFTYHRELSGIFEEVHIISLPKWRSYLNCLFAVFTREPLQVAYFRSRRMKHLVRSFLAAHPVDVIHTQHLRMAPFTEGISQPKILDLPDAFSLYWKRRIDNQTRAFKRFFERIEYRRLFRFEGRITHHFNRALVCSREDQAYLQKEHGSGNIGILRNGVDLDTFHSEGHDYSNRQVLLFTGNMDYAPNVDAVLYFTREIFPLIVETNPWVRFIIAGQRPVKQVTELQSHNIEVTGFVPDLRVMYQQASIVVSPLRFGAGTQNKVLEAMAMGIPVVSGKIGFEGLEIQNGEGVFLETEASGFVHRVTQLLGSEDLRRQTGMTGMRMAREKFSWDTIAAELEQYFEAEVK